jgi:uncharacterized membrane protein required for colicin V production
MKELLAVIPYLDVTIVVLLLFFLYIGWMQGVPRLLMAVGALYTGFLLAAVYYHLFAVSLSNFFQAKLTPITDLIAFFILFVAISVLMFALLLSLFGHIEVKGKAAIFDKLGGSVMGLFTGVLIISILVTILRIPYSETNKSIIDVKSMPVVEFFNGGYEKSALAPTFLRAAPILVWSVTPLLPTEAQEKGGVPLLSSLITEGTAK